MSLTPTGKDTDQLKNCVVTYYRTPKDKNQLKEISINHVKLANLKLQDFQTRKLINIFEVNPADYNVSNKDNNFILTTKQQITTSGKDTVLNPSSIQMVRLIAYGVRAQHSMWE